MMGGKRDWLVLSLKWSQTPPRPEYLIWYQTNDSGYTADLMRAGRYTEEEARKREYEGDTLAVPLSAALAVSETHCTVEAAARLVSKLKAAAKQSRSLIANGEDQ